MQQRAERLLAAALVVELHRQTDDVMTLLGEQGRGDRRVDASRHGDDDSHVCELGPGHGSDSQLTLWLAPRQASQLLDDARQHGDDAIDLGLGVRGPEAEANRVLRAMRGKPHRLQHVRRLERARRARRAGRDRDAFEVERDQQRLGLDAIEADVRRVRHARRRRLR